MKHRINKGIKMCVGIFAALLLAGCSTREQDKQPNAKQDVTAETEGEALVYKPTFIERVCELDAEDIIPTRAFYYMFVNDRAVYGIGKHYDSIKKTMNSYLITWKFDAEDYTQSELGIYESFYETGSGFAGYANKELMLYDEKFQPIRQVGLAKAERAVSDKNEMFSVDAVNVDAAGNICIKSGKELVYTDGDGAVLRVMDMPANSAEGLRSNNDYILAAPSGGWYLVYNNNADKFEICSVDMENGTLGEKLENVPDIYFSQMRKAGLTEDGALYIVTENYIYVYDSDNTAYRAVFCMQDYGIGSSMDSGKSAFGASESGDFYAVSVNSIDAPDVYDSDSLTEAQYGQAVVETAIIKSMQASEVSERKEIVLSAFTAPSWIYAEPINKFNRYNTEYYLTVKSYYNYDTEEYGTTLTKFYNDLITGNGADLFWFSSDDDINIDSLAEKGILADLYTYMDGDSDIHREDFMPSVMSALDSGGKLYVIAPEFGLSSIVGKAEYLEENEEWSFSAMYKLLESHSGAQLFLSGKNDQILDRFLRYSMDLFYDKDTGECSFDSDEFTDMLKVVQALPDTYISTDEDEKNAKLQNEEVLLGEYSVDIVEIMRIAADFKNIDKSYLGYPSKSYSEATMVFQYNMAVNNMSENKDAAWEFMKYYLENFEPSKFSVFEDKFEAKLDAALYEYDDDHVANSLYSRNLTEEEADTIRRLAHTASGCRQYDMAIYNIVYEETMSFIAGQRSAEEAASIIQNRAKLYLDEQD